MGDVTPYSVPRAIIARFLNRTSAATYALSTKNANTIGRAMAEAPISYDHLAGSSTRSLRSRLCRGGTSSASRRPRAI